MMPWSWSNEAENAQAGRLSETVALEVSSLCQRLCTEYELQHASVVEERDALRVDNQKLREQLAAAVKAQTQAVAAAVATAPRVQAKVLQIDSEALVVEPTEEIESVTTGKEASTHPASLPSNARMPTTATRMQTTSWEGSSGRTRSKASLDGSELPVLRKAFRDVDVQRRGYIRADELAPKMAQVEPVDEARLLTLLHAAFIAVNSVYPDLRPKSDLLDAVSFEGLRHILFTEMQDGLDEEVLGTLQLIRDFYVKFTTAEMIAERTHLTKQQMSSSLTENALPPWLEPCLGVVIFINALQIGLSQDIHQMWLGWTFFETACTAFFIFELAVKLRYVGCKEHFIGIGWQWNLFDFVIVVVAVLDLVFLFLSSYLGSMPSLNGVTVVRLVRLLRITRLVRLLRMKIFKELTLMVNGVIHGLRTLCWAFVFLGVLVYIFGVVVRQITRVEFGKCGDLKQYDEDEGICTTSEYFLEKHYSMLFSSVFRSSFTVFRCIIGDCTSPDGQPLGPYLLDVHGIFFIICYLVVLCFVFFGVFNLIMAIFVENTLESARLNQQKRQQERHNEHVRVAQELQKIVLMICTRRRHDTDTPAGFLGMIQNEGAERFKSITGGMFDDSESEESKESRPDMLQMSVTREVFHEVILDPKVIEILEDLEISIMDPTKLFEIIDSNGSGVVDLGELVEGLMKLRGPADKGDAVCSALMVRSVQRDLRRLEVELQGRMKDIQTTQDSIAETLKQQRGDAPATSRPHSVCI